MVVATFGECFDGIFVNCKNFIFDFISLTEHNNWPMQLKPHIHTGYFTPLKPSNIVAVETSKRLGDLHSNNMVLGAHGSYGISMQLSIL